MTRTAAIWLCLGVAFSARAATDVETAEGAAAQLFEAGSKTLALEKLEELRKKSADDLAAQVRIAEDERAIGRIDAADQQWEKRNWKEAATAFRQVKRDQAVQRVTTEAARARIDRRSGTASRRAFLATQLPWLQPLRSVLSVLSVLVPLALLILARDSIRCFRSLLRGKKDSQQIDVRVLDSMKSGWTADDALSSKVIAELRALAMPQRAQLSIESAGDAGDVATVALPDLPGTFSMFETVLDDKTSFKVGFIQISLKTLWRLLVRWFDPKEYWTATVAKDQDATLVMVKRKGVEPFRARVQGTDEAAQWTAMRLIAARISIVTIKDDAPTKVPEALVKFFTAVALTNQEPPKLDEARAALIATLRCDPRFWQARLRLVEVTRRLGELDLSRELLKQVEDDGKAGQVTVQYQQALIGAKATGYGELRGALRLLETLVVGFRSPQVDSRLAFSVASMHAVVSAQLLSLIHDCDPSAISQGAVEAVDLEKSLEENSSSFLAACPAEADPAFYRLAGALALTARGAWLNKRNNGEAARAPLLAAIARRADYVPALVGLATAYRLTKGTDRDWYEESRPWRDRALVIDPLDRDAIYEQGRALEAREPPALTEAAAAYAKIADRHAGARFYQGQLLLETDPTAGVRMMLEALKMSRCAQPGYCNVALRSLIQLPAKSPEALRTGVAKIFGSSLALFADAPPAEKPESAVKRQAALRDLQINLRKAVDSIARALGSATPPAGAVSAGRAALSIAVKDPDPKLAAALKALADALPGHPPPLEPTTD